MSGLVVQVATGKLNGRKLTDYDGNEFYAFQGIPYAKPPVGELRFEAPQKPDYWTGIRQATDHKNESISHHIISGEPIGSEDCLYLNVYTPRLPCCRKCRLPVLVYIHGGGLTSGCGHDYFIGPKFFMTEMIVLVTINYRLGILGFLQMRDNDWEIANNGFKDMILALKWVQENIDAFNGDRNSVNISGCSAGGMACNVLLFSPLAKGLFHRAMIQSGSAYGPWAIVDDNSVAIARASGYTGDVNNKTELLKHLRAIPSCKILEIQDKIKDILMPCSKRPWGVFIERKSDSAFIYEPPIQSILSGNYNKVPLIVGYLDVEGLIIDPMVQCAGFYPLNIQNFIPSYYNLERDSDLSKKVEVMIKEFYFGKIEPSIKNNAPVYLLYTDAFFVRGIYLLVKHHLAGGCPIYFFRFAVNDALNINRKLKNIKPENKGACHGDQTAYMYNNSETPTLTPNGTAENTMYRMVKMWTSFARTGNPNPRRPDPLINVKWEPVNLGCMNILTIDSDGLSFGPNPEASRMDFWDKVSEFVSQNRDQESGECK